MRVSFHTLGCKLNYAETAALERQFLERGYSAVPFSEATDICVINTCTVTQRAERECRQMVRRALRKSPDAFVIVLGCYAQLSPEAIASIDGVDLVLGTGEKSRLFDFAGDFRKNAVPHIHASALNETADFGPAYSGEGSDRTRAFLKVQDGCDFACSYCTIPLARGGSRSQTIDACVEQARRIVAEGYKEIVLTGVNVGDYGKGNGSSLLQLLQALETLEGLERIRISSIEPNLLTDELLTHWIQSEKICNHFHIPLQSGSNSILRAMRRRYTADEYRSLIQRIREQDPDAGIGADVIVGFPGETEAEFQQAYQFLQEIPVNYLHVFTYSERPNTPSVDRKDHVEPRVRYRRSSQLRVLGKKKRDAFHAAQRGKTLPVLLERTIENDMLSGYTTNYVRVAVPFQPALLNAVVPVRIGQYESEQCLGTVITHHHIEVT
ncbi:MAG: tRNA (N(6)-L-threonylcarbamoyladenosine(37)-C(2))-methylthiotransferase MtaB [Ignavibacteriales bacterium]|nr:tRNA (N(6)-L-threonylcarbamoyladenosine(37)-C(2))-methylthiotransferase MtaB [Ignavibacteriales bacterium]